MRRLLFTLLIIILVFPLAACGTVGQTETTKETSQLQDTLTSSNSQTTTQKNEEQAKPDYRYDTLSNYILSADAISSPFRPAKGGGVFAITRGDYLEADIPYEEWGSDILFVAFDEESKVLFPLCGDLTCNHETPECFSKEMLAGFNYFWNITDDMILFIGEFEEGRVGKQNTGGNKIYAYYFSLTGEIREIISYDLTSLTKTNGTTAAEPSRFILSSCASEDKYYFCIIDTKYDVRERLVDQWVISYDFETKEFECVSNFTIGAEFRDNYMITELTDSNLGIVFGKVYGYNINLEDGTYEKIDFAERFDELIIEGIIPEGSWISEAYPVRGLVRYISPDWSDAWLDINNGVIIDEPDHPFATNASSLLYHDDNIYHTAFTDKDDHCAYQKYGDDEIIEISNIFENGEYVLTSRLLEAEKGLIFTYRNMGKTVEDMLYTKNVNGIDIVYKQADQLVYVTKDDFFDGQIDDPWYYDAETGMFVQK